MYSKKQELNQQIYHLHLALAHTWDNTWQYIYERIEEKLGKETKAKYRILDMKRDHSEKTQNKTPHRTHTFHPTLINNTNIQFSKGETALLQKGLKYNLHSKPRNWIQNLALEAETAITQLPSNERDVYRKLVVDQIEKLKQQNPSDKTHPETKLIKSIRTKLVENNAMITRADKGNSLIILPTPHYANKIENFLSDNNCHTIAADRTNTFQTQVRNTVKQSKTLIPKDSRWKYINMNPSVLSIKGLIKIHKQGQLIIPVVNWRNAPAYHLSKLFTNQLNPLRPLPHAFNIRNTHNLLQNLNNTPMLPHYTLASLDITNLYSNILVTETKTILANILKQELVEPQTQLEILRLYDVITKQNYFSHKRNIIIQQDGLAMGTPSSGLIAEIFLQHLEHLHLTHLMHKHHIINYCRYIDDIFLIFYSNHTDIHNILKDFNALHPKIQFTAEVETDHAFNYLDVTIHKTPTNFKIAIYRKPTFTDTIIPYTSNHPTHHKYAAFRFLFNRLNSYNLQHGECQQELNTIHNNLLNNSFPIKPHKPHTLKPAHPKNSTTPQKWACFTHIGKETSYITNIFRRTDLMRALHTKNTIGNLLRLKNSTQDIYTLSGAYKLTCPNCNKAYV